MINPDLEPNDLVASRRREAIERSLQGARERAEQRTTTLIDGALELIGERGGADFTLQELLDHTKLSLHAFYRLFATKDDLIEAVLEESLERGALSLRERVDRFDAPVDRLREFVVGYFDLATGHAAMLGSGPAFAELTVHLGMATPEKVWRVYRPVRVLAYELMRAAIEDGSIRADIDPDVVAQFILSSVRSVAELEIAGSSVHTAAEQLWDMIAGGVLDPNQ
jgi:AcrR family transcriptional regulator